MKDDYSALLDVYKSHSNYLGNISTKLVKFNIESKLKNFFCPGPNFYFIIDSPTLTLDVVSDSVAEILGISPEKFTLKKFFERIHPEDLAFLLKCEDLVAHFLTKIIEPQKVTKYKINYCFRVKTAEGAYKLFLVQIMTLEAGVNGELLKVFDLLTDVSHFVTNNNYKLSFFGLDGEPSYTDIDVFDPYPFETKMQLAKKEFENPFTKREWQILKLLTKGLNSQDISEELFISAQTVSTHRKNILKKTEASNTLELIASCIIKGVL